MWIYSQCGYTAKAAIARVKKTDASPEKVDTISPQKRRSKRVADAAGGDMTAARKAEKEAAAIAPKKAAKASASSTSVAADPAPTKKATAASKAFRPLEIQYKDVGEVFVVGLGDCGQLGLGPDVLSSNGLKKIPYLQDKDIVHVAAGGMHNIALSSEGKVLMGQGKAVTNAKNSVYQWGTFRNNNGIFGFRPDIDVQDTPYKIPELKRVIQIDSGANHVMAFSVEKKIYVWGAYEQGQLGRRVLKRSEKQTSFIPRAINFFATHLGNHFVAAYCGGHHTFMVHESGALFAFGLNNHGQLGLGDLEEHEMPELVTGLDPENGIRMVAGAEHHSIVLDKKGRIYTFGKGSDGQLGFGDDETKTVPTLLDEPKDVRFISANGAFSLAVTEEESDNLFMWGYGEMGQLANKGENEDTPARVELKGRHVFMAAAGGQHTVLLIRPKEQ
ncbi:Regulator of chromosome condensation [Irineochytrium annulatum]|nr:Regulator of chromosome condensation [Irineochytrium annulatum]